MVNGGGARGKNGGGFVILRLADHSAYRPRNRVRLRLPFHLEHRVGGVGDVNDRGIGKVLVVVGRPARATALIGRSARPRSAVSRVARGSGGASRAARSTLDFLGDDVIKAHVN